MNWTPRYALDLPTTEFPLFVTDSVDRSIINEVNQTLIPFEDSDANVNFIEGQEEEMTLAGVATHDVFDQRSDYSDGERGMAEWTQDLFAVTGTNPELIDRVTSSTQIPVYVTRAKVQLAYPRDDRINWTLSLTRGEGFDEGSIERGTVDVGGSIRLDGLSLDHPTSFQMIKDVKTDTTVIPQPVDQENIVIGKGTSRSFDLTFKTRDESIIDQIRSMNDFTSSYLLETSFPGFNREVVVDDFGIGRATEDPIEYELSLRQ